MAESGNIIILDPDEAACKKAARRRRFDVVQVPLLRLIGFNLMIFGAWIHNVLIFGEVDSRHLGLLTAGLNAYVVVSWLVLKSFYDRVRRFNLGDLFLFIDLVGWALVIYATGANESLMFFLMMARVADQSHRGFGRALVITHVSTLIYVLLVGWVALIEGRPVHWGTETAKILFIYGFSLYISFIARTAEYLRRRLVDAVRLSRELIVKIEQEKTRAEAANVAKGRFLANMSHEIRTPMSAIIGLSRLMTTEELASPARRYAEDITASAEGLLGLIDDILDFSKIEAGKLAIETVDFAPRDTLEGVVALLAPSAGQKGIELVATAAPELPARVHGPASRLRQMLINLAGNAVKFTERGTVRLEAVPEVPRDERLWIRFVVRDTGIGISEDDQALLFRAFSQVDTSASRQFGGTGLGLAISRSVVELLGGQIGVESTPGEGSTFWFTVPLETARGVTESPLADRPAAVRRRLSILVVEDNAVLQKIAEAQLAAMGHRSEVVGNGLEALAALERRDYDLVLMDCQMPELDGYETTRRIRQRQTGDRLPVIAVTAHAMEGDRERCLEAGMDDYISKPFQPDELAAVIDRWASARPIRG